MIHILAEEEEWEKIREQFFSLLFYFQFVRNTYGSVAKASVSAEGDLNAIPCFLRILPQMF